MDTSKVIRGVVNSGRYTVTAPIVKEDYGLYLQIEGVELPSTYEVDFSNSESSGTSVTMIGNSDGVLIPRQFIDTGKDIFAFLYHVGDNYGRTVYKFRIPNKVRPDRTNEEPTTEEQSVIDQAINALNEAVEQTAQDVIDADTSARSAQGYAEQAETAKTNAQTYANNAQTSANNASASASQASASATASANSASQSAQIKSDVEDLVDDAQASADASERSASNAHTYATSAERSSVNASASESSAQGYASNAQTSANTASAKAQDASTSAQTASQKATEASQSATNASQSAQDAEQAKVASQTAQGLAESAMDSAVQAKTDAESAKADAESARDEAQNIVDGISGALDDKAPVITDTASGAIASFSDGADNLPLKSLIVDINPIQDLSHGDPSPENICPISGWDTVNVQRTGKNLFDGSVVTTSTPANWGVTWDDTTATLTIEHKNTYSTGTPFCRLDIPPGTYTIKCASAIGTFEIRKNRAYLIQCDTTARQFTVEDGDVCVAYFYNANMTTFVFKEIQLELSSTATPYEPYTGRSITIDLGQTVYGGKLDVLSGELTVYPYYASYNGETLTGEWISDRDKYVSGTAPTIGAQVVNIGAQGVTVQLEPHEVESLHGVNNIWADSGDTEAVYRADTKAYIAKKIAEAISALS